VRGGDGGSGGQGHREPGGSQNDPFDRGLHAGRLEAGRHTGQAPGRHQPREHRLRDQKTDRQVLLYRKQFIYYNGAI